ncbi:MAG: FMN-binding protein [Tissierellia bacterium]|nr:FMN-binding protein [Tissierellia bacterium]
MKESIKFGFILLLFCAISAGLLSLVNSFTAPVIAETQLKETLKSYEEIFGEEVESFEELDSDTLDKVKEAHPNIAKVFIAQKEGKTIGYGINVFSNGFGGQMENAIGFLNEGDRIAGFRNISHQETKGFGSKIEEPDYYNSYEDKNAAGELECNTNPDADNQIMLLSGATVSSEAVLVGANEAVEAFQMLKAME